MNLKARFSLIGIGIVLFLIATPILVLYARGFKFDYKTGQITKTGALVVKTHPDDAQIFIDGENVGESPANIRFLLPKDYEVRIEKEGYQPWTKRLSVASQFVTWANAYREFVTLFYTTPKLENEFKTSEFSFSKYGSEVAFVENGSYKLLNASNGDIVTLGSPTQVSFPKISGKNIIWQNGTKSFEMLLQKPRLELSKELLGSLVYIEADGERMILLTSTKDLYIYDFDTLKLIDRNVAAATLAQDGIWYVQNRSIKHLEFNQNTPQTLSAPIPVFVEASISRFENKIFIILDSTLYVVNDKLEPIHTPVSFMRWNDISGQLLFGNPNEIQIYNPTTKNMELILRTITPILNAKVNAETGFAFYMQDNSIKAIEMDGRDRRNIHTIVSNAGSNPSFEISNDGRRLFLFNSDGGKFYTIR